MVRKNFRHTEETKRKLSKAGSKQFSTKESREKHSKLMKEIMNRNDIKKTINEGRKNMTKKDVFTMKKNQSKSRVKYFKENPIALVKLSKQRKGIKRPKEVCRKISKTQQSDEWKRTVGRIKSKKISKAFKKLWQDEKWRFNTLTSSLKGRMKRPTSYEQLLINYFKRFNLPFTYTGDGRFFVGKKNPDFIFQREKIAIEVYSIFWKDKTYGSEDNYKHHCNKIYFNKNWNVVYLNENDLFHKNWESICLEKIKNEGGLKWPKI